MSRVTHDRGRKISRDQHRGFRQMSRDDGKFEDIFARRRVSIAILSSDKFLYIARRRDSQEEAAATADAAHFAPAGMRKMPATLFSQHFTQSIPCFLLTDAIRGAGRIAGVAARPWRSGVSDDETCRRRCQPLPPCPLSSLPRRTPLGSAKVKPAMMKWRPPTADKFSRYGRQARRFRGWACSLV